MSEESISTSPVTVSTRDFMRGYQSDTYIGGRKNDMRPPFNNYARAMRDLRYLNAIRKYGPIVGRIAKGLGISENKFHGWLIDATWVWPIYEDDNGRIYYGEPRS